MADNSGVNRDKSEILIKTHDNINLLTSAWKFNLFDLTLNGAEGGLHCDAEASCYSTRHPGAPASTKNRTLFLL